MQRNGHKGQKDNAMDIRKKDTILEAVVHQTTHRQPIY